VTPTYCICRIRDNYRRLLFLDPVYASGKEVEQSLWKVGYHSGSL
jgi:hypothetical protein